MTDNFDYDFKLLEHAKEIAIATHIHQQDKTGAPYLEHISRVTESLDTTEEKIVGYLHDVLEDCEEELKPILVSVLNSFPTQIVNAIEILTRKSDERYQDYIDRIISSKNPLALRVKIADMKDNLRETEDIIVKSLSKRYNKYLPKLQESYEYLKEPN